MVKKERALVIIRLARKGRVHRPSYTLVVADSRRSRDGRFLEALGKYDPFAKKGEELQNVKQEALKSWLAKGAQISATVRSLLKRNEVTL